MIVRNEAHIIGETFDTVAPYINSWVIVDTGSHDGTQDLIRDYMARRGIQGELYERPWRNFGHNRSEALTLAQGRGDYIWVIDADDTVVGTLDFGQLGADIYELRQRSSYGTFWRPLLFRDGLRVRYEGVVHEYVTCDDPFVGARLEGDYHIESRRLGARNRDPQKYARDRDLLLAEVERNPEDARSVFYLAQSCCDLGITNGDLGDFADARKWYERRAEMGGWDEEAYYSKFTIAEIMPRLGAPWPEVQDAYLRAWEFRPTRAEPLYTIARRYREDQRYRLGYLFAKRAAEIPLPEQDKLFVLADVYAWRAIDEQAVCASWIDKHAEAFTLNRRLLARPDLPDDDRQRIAANRDVCAPKMIEAASTYPDALVQSVQRVAAGPREAEVVVSLVAGPDRGITEHTLNSFLRCCTDVSRVGRFLVIDAGLSTEDRAILLERYGFLEFAHPSPDGGSDAQLAQLRGHIDQRFWLHLGQGWRFFAPENFITRLTAVLKNEPQVFQVAINFADAVELTGASAPEATVRRTREAGRYVLTREVACGPTMFDTARLDRAGGVHGVDPDPIAALGRRAATAGLRTASLDEVLCIAAVDQVQPPAQAIHVRFRQPESRPGASKEMTHLAPTGFAVAVVSPPDYEHSEAFREVAQALHFGLLALGQDSVLTERLDLDDRSTIVLGSNLLARYGLEPPKNAILYNLEQVHYDSDDSAWMTPALFDLFRRYPVWDYSQANIERLAALQVPRLTHVPIGYVPELTRIVPGPEDIDVLFYGSIDERREAVLDKLRAKGLRVKSLFGVYGASRDAWIARSKIVINMHVSYYKAQIFEIVRVSYLLANRRVVVSERGADPTEEHDLESGVAFAEYDELVDRCVELIEDEQARRELGERGYQAFSARSQAAILRRALAAGPTEEAN
jgi:glycosyltransferase involved in cell wall biosynthesis